MIIIEFKKVVILNVQVIPQKFTSISFYFFFPGAVDKEFKEADEESEEHDGEGHRHHSGVLLLVRVSGPSPRGLQREPRILQNLLQHLHGRKSGGGGQDHQGLDSRHRVT